MTLAQQKPDAWSVTSALDPLLVAFAISSLPCERRVDDSIPC
jgi:hypothetical protein